MSDKERVICSSSSFFVSSYREKLSNGKIEPQKEMLGVFLQIPLETPRDKNQISKKVPSNCCCFFNTGKTYNFLLHSLMRYFCNICLMLDAWDCHKSPV